VEQGTSWSSAGVWLDRKKFSLTLYQLQVIIMLVKCLNITHLVLQHLLKLLFNIKADFTLISSIP
jgi:hypothetical protein